MEIDAQKLFTHEAQLKEELEKLKVKLSIAEEVEKRQKENGEAEKTETNEEKAEEKTEGTMEEMEEKVVVKEDVTAEDKSKENESKPFTNGHLDPKVKLVNGDCSTDSDTTAVNTPGSSTPLPKVTSMTPDAVDLALEPTLDVLRLQSQHLQKLLNFLENEFAPTRQKLNDLLENNDMKFGLLWCLFRLGSEVTFKDYESGLTMAGEVFPRMCGVNE